MNDFLSEVFNPDAVWSWILTLVGVAGFYFAGKKKWWCWYINLANQAFWVAYSLITEQWGFLLGCLVYSWVFGRNAVEWTRARNTIKTPQPIGTILEFREDSGGISVSGHLNTPEVRELIRNDPIDVQTSLHFYPAGYCWQIVDGLLCGKEECDEVHTVKGGHDFLREAPYLGPSKN